MRIMPALRVLMSPLALAILLNIPSLVAGQTVHHLPATPTTVAYGYYWSEAPPVLRIESGDFVEVETMITSRPDLLEQIGVPPEEVQQSLRDIIEQVTDRGPGGHILTGPIYVEGAEPGDAIEVRLLTIDLPIAYGYNRCAGFAAEYCPEQRIRLFRLDRDRMVSNFAPGIVIPLRPFFGSIGVAPPPDAGRWSSVPPWIHAGNLDNKELVAGTSLFIPVHVPGALLQLGDGHAAQGDGEVDQTAIETSLTGMIQVVVHKGMKLEWPFGETPTHYITMGSDEDLTRATEIAIEQTVKFLRAHFKMDPGEAYRLISVAADLRITELVDQKMGVHVMIPKAIFIGPTGD
ncbi:MAG: acetamidase/formamidase family protein [Gemmatimonadota bacterium]|nr:MAG: acetamidase/formamidase family protein [Gemmatimonadota bacterium]